VLHMSRLEVGQTAGRVPVLTLPVGTR
jgi:hypothetical protein